MSGLQGVKGLYEKRGWLYFQPPTQHDGSGKRPKPIALKTRDLVTALQLLDEKRMEIAIERAVIAGTLKEVLPQYFAAKKEDTLLTRRGREVILTGFMNDTGNPKASELTTELIENWRASLTTRPRRSGANQPASSKADTRKPGVNGRGNNGTGSNGTGSNGTGSNGTGSNGTGSNGTGSNGVNVQPLEKPVKLLSGATIKSYTITLRAFVNWLREQKILRTDPMAKLKRQTRVSTTRRHEFLTEEQRECLLAATMPDYARLILMLGFFAGLRDGEMLAMTPDWIWLAPDGTRGTITVQETPCKFTDGTTGVWRPKTRQMRTVPMHPRLLAFIRDYGLRSPWMLAPEKELWPDESKNAKRFDAKKAIHGVAKRAGVAHLNFHMLRHSFATHLAMKGVPLAEIAGLLGDSLRVTEDHYAGFCPNKVNPLEVL